MAWQRQVEYATGSKFVMKKLILVLDSPYFQGSMDNSDFRVQGDLFDSIYIIRFTRSHIGISSCSGKCVKTKKFETWLKGYKTPLHLPMNAQICIRSREVPMSSGKSVERSWKLRHSLMNTHNSHYLVKFSHLKFPPTANTFIFRANISFCHLSGPF